MNTVIEVSDFVLEVTRRCNMCCDHCLRGMAQNMDITDEIIRNVSKIVLPDHVCFTGGEPSLNVKAIDSYFRYAKEEGTLPHAFFVATNGKENQEELALCLLQAYALMSEPEICSLALSQDIFHDYIGDSAKILDGLSFFDREMKRHPLDETDPKWVVNAGRAYETGLGKVIPQEYCRDLEEMIEDILFYGDEMRIRVPELYVSSNGNVITSCDAPYDEIDELAICTIDNLVDEFLKLKIVKECLREHERKSA